MAPTRKVAPLLVLLASALACSLPGIGSPPLDPTIEPDPTPDSEVVIQPDVGVADLIRSTVQILAMIRDGSEWQPIWSGSGSLVSENGLILTNSHVVDTTFFEYDALGVAMTDRSDAPPTLEYLAEVIAEDKRLDLAVIRIITNLSGDPVSLSFPYVVPGDSANVEIGDDLRVLGYPGIGGETITLTEGAVSGFSLERGVDGRAWIKTDATIAGGNSGGMGTDASGRLIGVPTIVTSGSESGQTVDCRPLADTDRDGDIDNSDTCVPVGGFINALRPINLALPLIDAAVQGRQYAEGSADQTSTGTATGQPTFSSLVFSDGVTDDQPSQLWYALPDASTTICAFWDYEGLSNGSSWSSYWFVNGELDTSASLPSQTWGGDDRGNWWVCNFNEGGLPLGVYELVLEVEDEVLLSDSVFVGGDRVEIALTLDNASGLSACEINLAPDLAQNWGQNDLAEEQNLAPGGSLTLSGASGTYDLRVLGCEGELLLEQFGLSLDSDAGITIPG